LHCKEPFAIASIGHLIKRNKIEHTDEYSDFSYDIRPSIDFVLALMSYTDGLEVLEPIELRQKMCDILQASLERYSN
jgi:hypothetical protein